MADIDLTIRACMRHLSIMDTLPALDALAIMAGYLAGEAESLDEAVKQYDYVIETLLNARLVNVQLYTDYFEQRGKE